MIQSTVIVIICNSVAPLHNNLFTSIVTLITSQEMQAFQNFVCVHFCISPIIIASPCGIFNCMHLCSHSKRIVIIWGLKNSIWFIRLVFLYGSWLMVLGHITCRNHAVVRTNQSTEMVIYVEL